MEKSKLIKASEQLEKVAEFLTENIKALSDMNLKYYDAAFIDVSSEYPLTAEEYPDSLYHFCECEYDNFLEEVKSQGLEFDPHYIGRTSSFYLHDNSLIEWDRHGSGICYSRTLEYLLDHFTYHESLSVITEVQQSIRIEYDQKWEEEAEEDINCIISGEFLSDVKNYFDNAIKVYEIIKAYKDNQADSFRDYLSYYENELQAEQEEAEKEEKARLEMLKQFNDVTAGIYNKYRINVNDMEMLIAYA